MKSTHFCRRDRYCPTRKCGTWHQFQNSSLCNQSSNSLEKHEKREEEEKRESIDPNQWDIRTFYRTREIRNQVWWLINSSLDKELIGCESRTRMDYYLCVGTYAATSRNTYHPLDYKKRMRYLREIWGKETWASDTCWVEWITPVPLDCRGYANNL